MISNQGGAMNELKIEQVRVLVVEDEATFLKLMESYLRKLGCVTTLCHNGKEALEAVKTCGYDICFMDIMMPVMNGIEATQIIREEYSKILPIIALTSSGMKATRETCFDVGMNDFVMKPVSIEVIRDAIVKYALKSSGNP